MGCSLQVNLLSLSGYYGSAQKKLSVKLLKADLVDYLGTDLHRQSQLKYLSTHIDVSILKLLGRKTFKNNQLWGRSEKVIAHKTCSELDSEVAKIAKLF